ncbi:unnamed protein product [Didymodactylos carnosus]|uniref:UBX domain-containing protein n=1 Tax=Didymodactylos carnosus TaxID=1234261 RepID=A0A813WWC2_9BILA|nr:unnamed protein product [Didymodactylos carnosus]CAF0931957.1 unnamed protein product [Didymodactylos carnosus]CAF3644585.1 unnamed protein product [Didymodactylos carnosus]CAF3708401.1 unnamed protein product [Didymodactylos carnosus]
MSGITKFFSKIKREIKFSKAGEGHKLNEQPTSPKANTRPTNSYSYEPRPNTASSTTRRSTDEAARNAAEAAQARLQQQQPPPAPANRTQESIRRQAQRELEQEKSLSDEYQKALDLKDHYFGKRQISMDSSSALDLSNVLFKCPDIFGDDVCLPPAELESKIEETLKLQLASEPLISCILLFLTSNKKNIEQLQNAKDIILKYYDNIINNPDEEKYRKIRLKNKVFQEKILPLKYASELLQTSGFIYCKLKINESDSDEDDYLYYKEKSTEPLALAKDTLINAEPIKTKIDTNLRIFRPTKERSTIPTLQLLPNDFYNPTMRDIMTEKQRQKDYLEKEEMLRTKAMRERDQKSESSIQYKYTVLRIRMPDEIILQVTFESDDNLSSLFEFLRSCLVYDWMTFILTSMADRQSFSSEHSEQYSNVTFNQSRLVNVVLSFKWDDAVLKEILHQKPDFQAHCYVKNEIIHDAMSL